MKLKIVAQTTKITISFESIKHLKLVLPLNLILPVLEIETKGLLLLAYGLVRTLWQQRYFAAQDLLRRSMSASVLSVGLLLAAL